MDRADLRAGNTRARPRISLPVGLPRPQPVLAALGLIFLASMFQASLAVFLLSLAWCAGYLTPHPSAARKLRWIVPVAVVASLYEAIYVTWQAAHGQASHWNTVDPLHRVLWALMGVGALLLSYTAFALARVLRRHANPRLAPAFRLSLVLGLGLTFILGALTGIVMVVSGSHFADHLAAEPGLPVLGWSTTGGDWRPPHFLGMHASQVVPAFGAVVGAMGIRRGTTMVVLFAGAYTALTLFTLALALPPSFRTPGRLMTIAIPDQKSWICRVPGEGTSPGLFHENLRKPAVPGSEQRCRTRVQRCHPCQVPSWWPRPTGDQRP